MSIKFKVPAPEKYYTPAIADSDADLDRLAELISCQYTVTETGGYAVLMAEHNIIGELHQDRIVKLGTLGNFQAGLSAARSGTAVEVSTNSISKSHILFRP